MNSDETTTVITDITITQGVPGPAMHFISGGTTLCEFTHSGDFRLGPRLTEEQIEAHKKALAEAAEWEKQHAEEQDKERRKLMRLPRKELERILFYYLGVSDKKSLVERILEAKEYQDFDEVGKLVSSLKTLLVEKDKEIRKLNSLLEKSMMK